ncbi:hypothetical protein GE278_21435 (plasmid) [Enterobacteriaceae bacterium Kacie_13]|nr:hypothetical protein GE278_21435 [Enterobacteriaceae bacterium Kacie_13]
MFSNARAHNETMKIRTLFNIKNSFCAIYTNGTLGLNNRNSAYSGRGNSISSTNALLFLENGKNTISLDIGALGWFSDEILKDNERAKFNPQASCRLDLVQFKDNTKTILASIKVKIDNFGEPAIASEVNTKIMRIKRMAEQIEPGHFDPEYFDEKFFPKNMVVYNFSLDVSVFNIPIWRWVNATPFDGTKNQIDKLRESYTEMSKIINSGNRTELKKYDGIALKAWSTTTGESEDSILESQYSKQELEGHKIKINAINWDDYAVRTMNQGRIVQFYNKSNPTASPLSYYTIDEDGDDFLGSIAPMFSLIDGKFVPVI